MAADESSAYIAGSAPRGDAWAGEAAATGHRGTQRIAFARWTASTGQVAAALAIAAGEPVAMRRRIVLLDDRPIEIADAYYPAHVAEGTSLAQPARIRGGVATLLAERGFTASTIRETVSARLPNEPESETLQISDQQPVLVLERISISPDGTPFEYAVMVMNADGRELHYNTRSE